MFRLTPNAQVVFGFLLLCGVIPRYPIGWQVTDATRTWKISLHQGPCSLAPAPHPAHLKVPPKLRRTVHQGVTAPHKGMSLGSLEGEVLCGSRGGRGA